MLHLPFKLLGGAEEPPRYFKLKQDGMGDDIQCFKNITGVYEVLFILNGLRILYG